MNRWRGGALAISPSKIGQADYSLYMRSSAVHAAVLLGITLTGIPAFVMMSIWNYFDPANVYQIGALKLWLLWYIVSWAVVLPPLVVLGAIAFVARCAQVTGLRLIVSETGFGWDDRYRAAAIAMVGSNAPMGIVPWKEVKCILGGQITKAFLAENNINSSELPYWIWSRDTVSFVLKRRTKKGKLRFKTIRVSSFSDDAKLELLGGLLKWSKQVPMTDGVIEMLGGKSAKREDPRYTQLWLQLLAASGGEERKGALAPGDLVSHYTIESHLKTGGQANIYFARSAGGELVVLKEFVLSQVSSTARVMSTDDFENECMMLSKYDSENIVKLLDVFVEGSHAFLVLEAVEGPSLRVHVETEGALTAGECIRMARGVCEALKMLHNSRPPVVHRDISPENILIGDGFVKLIDFSLALEEKSEPVEQVVGKQAYISAEQFRGDVNPVNDLYALGATMFFALTAQEPEPISQQSPQAVRSDISERLDKIVRKCTAIDADERYKAVEELEADLLDVSLEPEPAV